VNAIPTTQGGTHEQGFRAAIVKAVRSFIETTDLAPKGVTLTAEDIREGIVGVLSLYVHEPQFQGQTKERLGSPEAQNQVDSAVRPALEKFLLENRTAGAAIVERIGLAAKAREASRAAAQAVSRKTAVSHRLNLPGKLADCSSTDPGRSELFIVEGDSALGTAKLARNSEFQALLPIRGKILNVQKASLADMLKNAECASIIQVIGAGSGNSFDLDSARYQRVIFMADADVDGAHIRTLLLTLFHRYLRPMMDAGRVFAAVPPLHRIELTSTRKGQDKYRYTYSDAELNRTLLELERRGQRWKEPVQRYKGLGEMDASQLAETTMDPRRRTLRRIRIEDAAGAAGIFNLLMGTEVAPRRDFIVGGAAELDPSRIDT